MSLVQIILYGRPEINFSTLETTEIDQPRLAVLNVGSMAAHQRVLKKVWLPPGTFFTFLVSFRPIIELKLANLVVS